MPLWLFWFVQMSIFVWFLICWEKHFQRRSFFLCFLFSIVGLFIENGAIPECKHKTPQLLIDWIARINTMNYGRQESKKDEEIKAEWNISQFFHAQTLHVGWDRILLWTCKGSDKWIAYYRISTQIKMVILLLEHKIYIEINLLMKSFINTLIMTHLNWKWAFIPYRQTHLCYIICFFVESHDSWHTKPLITITMKMSFESPQENFFFAKEIVNCILLMYVSVGVIN